MQGVAACQPLSDECVLLAVFACERQLDGRQAGSFGEFAPLPQHVLRKEVDWPDAARNPPRQALSR